MREKIPKDIKGIEKSFDTLSNITNEVALINSDYDSDFVNAITKMKSFVTDLREWELDEASYENKKYYLSCMSFHREIVADIIVEARALLIDERREHLKRIVKYHKEFCAWLKSVERKYQNA